MGQPGAQARPESGVAADLRYDGAVVACLGGGTRAWLAAPLPPGSHIVLANLRIAIWGRPS
jgi:hypothetical protein